jgi:SEC-C motif domain protein
MISNCPCGSPLTYLDCCGLYIEKQHIAPTPEALMRARFSAYTLANTAYIKSTMRGKALAGYNEYESKTWAEQVTWIGLKVINTFPELAQKHIGFVEFIATFEEKKQEKKIHEKSEFQFLDGAWYYVDGEHVLQNSKPKKIPTPRNSPCPCGSKKKFKNCHARSS